jgi:hypothetical protein
MFKRMSVFSILFSLLLASTSATVSGGAFLPHEPRVNKDVVAYDQAGRVTKATVDIAEGKQVE